MLVEPGCFYLLLCYFTTELLYFFVLFAVLLFLAILLYYLLFCCILLYCVLSTILLVYHAPSRLHLESRPVLVEPGFYYFITLLFHYCTILLLYYLTISLLYYCSNYCFCITLLLYCLLLTILLVYHAPSRLHLENRSAPVEPGFCHYIILLFQYYTTVLFTVLLFRYYTILLLTVLLCTNLRLTILLFYHAPTRPFTSRKPHCAG